MKNIEAFINQKKTKYIILILAAILFDLSYVLAKNELAYHIVLGIKDIILGLIISFILICSKDTKTCLFTILVYPFSSYSDITQYMSDFTLQVIIYSLLFIWIISIIIHIILYKPKFKMKKFGFSVLIYAIAFSIGGLFSKQMNGLYPQENYIVFIVMILSILAWFIYIFFSSTAEGTFNDLSFFMILLSLLLIYECLFYASFNFDTMFRYEADTMMILRWGDKNTFGLALLMTMPFSLYYAYKNIHRVLAIILYAVQFLILLLVSCKGGALAAAIGSLVMVIVWLLNVENKARAMKAISIAFITGVVVTILSFVLNPSMRNFGTMFSRKKIYEESIRIFLSAPIFGNGYIGMLKWHLDDLFGVQFAHNIFLQILANSGLIGLILMLYHLLIKYARVLFKPSLKKMILFFSFLYADLYGLINPTYPMPTYLIPLVISFILFEKEIEEDNIKYLF